MKQLLLVLLLLGSPLFSFLTWVRERNNAVSAGVAAYERGEPGPAAAQFATALAARGQQKADPNLVLNLAHAQARAGLNAAAQASYGRVLGVASPGIGSVARQQLAVLALGRGEAAQALNLLRQALLLDPTNGGARYDYEVLSEYLAKRPFAPRIPPPPQEREPGKPKPTESPKKEDKKGRGKNKPGEKSGTDRQGEANDPQAPPPPDAGPQPRPNASGQPTPQQPGPGTGNAGNGLVPGRRSRPIASGNTPGPQRGLDPGAAAGPAVTKAKEPGAAAAAATDSQLQTQRERLEAMSLSPAQARQLLETMRAQEQQYLQQLATPPKRKPDPSKPSW